VSEIEAPPKADKKDLLYKLGKIGAAVAGGVTMIPGMSAAATEFYSIMLRSPLAKRTDDFLTHIYEKLVILEQKIEGFSIESLKDNEQFVSIIYQATQRALGNHDCEKLEALQNAVLNTAKGIDIDGSIQMMLLRYLDNLTPLHLGTLRLMENPRGYLQEVEREYSPNVTGTSLKHMIEHALPELRKQHENIRIIYQDLYNYGLVNTSPDSLGVSMTTSASELYAQRTTDMARVLLRYISVPKELGRATESR
jgi:hypothetical protein